MLSRFIRLTCLLFPLLFVARLPAQAADLNQTQLKLLQDPQGWEYTAILDQDNGFPMKHQCFVKGQSNPNECRGTLVLTDDRKFTQKVFVHGAVDERQGTYELDSGQITFKDELGTKDGPYALEVNPETRSMRFSMRQAGVLIGAELMLESEYRKGGSNPKTSKQN